MRIWLPLAAVLAAACQTTTPAPEADPATPADAASESADPSPAEAAKAETTSPKIEVDPQLDALFDPLPADMATPDRPVTAARVSLGRMLYFDTRLSKNQDISCNSCHMLGQYGVDGEPTSPGHKGQRGDRNSPTVYNAALHTAQFWDGRATDVEEQAKGPVLNPIEMAMPDEAHVEKVLASIPGYAEPFATAFPDAENPISYDHMALAIGAFERTLVTPGRFDRYLQGEEALTEAELAGAKLFVETGCATCHMGATLGGTQYQKLGLVEPYDSEDEGRKKVTGKESDLHVFKVPSLRNITETAPYFHDGSIATLDEAVRLMGKHQLGKQLDDEQVQSIITFLGTLKGDIPDGVADAPPLPETGPDTPKPDPS